MVYTVRLAGIGRQGGRNGFEATAPRLARGPEELPTQPPHHLRQGRTLPTDHEEVAPRTARQPATIAELQALLDDFVDEYNHRRPHRSLPHRATPAALYNTTAQGPARAHAETPRPTTGSATTASTNPAPSPCASTANSATSASAEPTREPTSSCSSRTSTSASSTPSPANSSASSPSTPAPRLPTPRNDKDPNPQSVGSGLSDVLRHHMVGVTGFEPAASSSRTTRATKLRHSPKAWASLPERSGCSEPGRPRV